MAEDRLWCVADPHFAEDDPAFETFLRFLSAFGDSEASHLVLLGDLFSVWVALEKAQSAAQSRVAAEFRRLRGLRHRIVFLQGNRDYFLDCLRPEPFDVIADRWDFRADCGSLIRFEHGDLINTSDRAYLRWRRLSRSLPVRRLFTLLPGSAPKGAADWMKRRLAPTNREYKAYWPEEELARWAADLASSGYAGAVVGHFHEDREIALGGVRVRFVPQFGPSGLHLRVRGDGSWSLVPFGGQ